MLGVPTTKPLRLTAYGSAMQCQADITSFHMVPFGSIPGCNYEHVNRYLAEHGIPTPIMVPAHRQIGYDGGYYELEFALSPTEGMLAWLCNEGLRKKDEAQKQAVEKLTTQQQALCRQIQKLQQQYEHLQQELKSAQEAERKDAKLIQKLTTKIELLLELLTDVGANPKSTKKHRIPQSRCK